MADLEARSASLKREVFPVNPARFALWPKVGSLVAMIKDGEWRLPESPVAKFA